jgi:hypothetical protein
MKLRSSFYDPEPKHFKFQEMEALVGNDGEIIYEVIPKNYSKSFVMELYLSTFHERIMCRPPSSKPNI